MRRSVKPIIKIQDSFEDSNQGLGEFLDGPAIEIEKKRKAI